jgi:hypothetical protein
LEKAIFQPLTQTLHSKRLNKVFNNEINILE